MRFFQKLSFLILIIAFALALKWLCDTKELEPAITSLGLIATIFGILVDRVVAEQERRRTLLHALVHETYINLNVLSSEQFLQKDPPKIPVVYPRFYISVLQNVISSGAFSQTRDKKLFKLLYDWQQRANEFNHRMHITELRTFTNPTYEELSAFHKKLRDGQVMAITKTTLKQLAEELVNSYQKESGITKDTILFKD